MKIYTSYFSNIKNLPKNIVPISICGKAPDSYNGLQYKKLAPKYDFFMKWKRSHNDDYYISCFKFQILDKLNFEKVIEDLAKLGKGNDVALICYEKPKDFCHRHLVSDWLNDNGFLCEEYPTINEQIRLF